MQQQVERSFYRGELMAYGVCPKCKVICKFRSMDQSIGADVRDYKCRQCNTPVRVIKLTGR